MVDNPIPASARRWRFTERRIPANGQPMMLHESREDDVVWEEDSPWRLEVLDAWAALERVVIACGAVLLAGEAENLISRSWKLIEVQRARERVTLLVDLLRAHGTEPPSNLVSITSDLYAMRNDLAHKRKANTRRDAAALWVYRPTDVGQQRLVRITYESMAENVRLGEAVIDWLNQNVPKASHQFTEPEDDFGPADPTEPPHVTLVLFEEVLA